MPRRKHFGRALHLTRKAKGISQEDFSSLSSRTYISTLERGLKSPTLGKVEELAQVLAVHPLTLLALSYVGESSNNIKQLLLQVEAEIEAIDGGQKRKEKTERPARKIIVLTAKED